MEMKQKTCANQSCTNTFKTNVGNSQKYCSLSCEILVGSKFRKRNHTAITRKISRKENMERKKYYENNTTELGRGL